MIAFVLWLKSQIRTARLLKFEYDNEQARQARLEAAAKRVAANRDKTLLAQAKANLDYEQSHPEQFASDFKVTPVVVNTLPLDLYKGRKA